MYHSARHVTSGLRRARSTIDLLIVASVSSRRGGRVPASSRGPIRRSGKGVRGAVPCKAQHGGPTLLKRIVTAVGNAAPVVRAPGAGIGGGIGQGHCGERQQDEGDLLHGRLLGNKTSTLITYSNGNCVSLFR